MLYSSLIQRAYPRMVAILQLSSPMTFVRLSNLLSMRTSKYQLRIIGKPKSLI